MLNFTRTGLNFMQVFTNTQSNIYLFLPATPANESIASLHPSITTNLMRFTFIKLSKSKRIQTKNKLQIKIFNCQCFSNCYEMCLCQLLLFRNRLTIIVLQVRQCTNKSPRLHLNLGLVDL